MMMEVQEQATTEMVSFPYKPQTKILLHNRATALNMKISEYLNLIVQDYKDQ